MGAYRALLPEESYAVNGGWEKEGHFLQWNSHLQQGALAAATLMKLTGKGKKREGKGGEDRAEEGRGKEGGGRSESRSGQ